MIKDNDISIKRSGAGSKGGFATKLAKAKLPASTEYEYEYEIETDNEDVIKGLWIKTFGRNPSIPEQDETQKLTDKFGYKKTYEIMYQANLDGFKKIKTLINALDDRGNLKPKEDKFTKEPTGRVIKEGNEFKKVLAEANKQKKWDGKV